LQNVPDKSVDRNDFVNILRATLPLIKGIVMLKYYLGYFQYRDKGVPQDLNEAIRLYRLATDQGLNNIWAIVMIVGLDGRDEWLR
jgi:hypothetical protein